MKAKGEGLAQSAGESIIDDPNVQAGPKDVAADNLKEKGQAAGKMREDVEQRPKKVLEQKKADMVGARDEYKQ